ncbi:hypothetical protein NDR87_09330 [Nocardia sp. CDC159]|uniref:Uncharacterized protein n=1 Tax=Nocardia pulmonis TaxID=2951408 RepID=A0A9X2E3S7_9NOCA|nr:MULTISPECIES: hypothetical protein [Nocardia]MCM6773669.1 hypothetical protein [Nocardia pulmonis]MCM6786556.1 hypothetical protein [Nocardia sp. CDC159]
MAVVPPRWRCCGAPFWLHNRTRRGVTAAILLHTMLNVVPAASPDLQKPLGTITIGIVTTAVAAGVVMGPYALRVHRRREEA